MSDHSHAEHEHVKKQPSNPNYKVPLALPIIALLIIAGLWFYADRYDPGNPKNVVGSLYKALNAKQYDKVADSFSVMFLAEFAPEYMGKKPSELTAQRPEIVKKAAEMFGKILNEQPCNVTILAANVKTGSFAAVVPYYLEMGGQKQLNAALLVKENNQFKVLSISILSEQELQEFSEAKFKALEENIKIQFDKMESMNTPNH